MPSAGSDAMGAPSNVPNRKRGLSIALGVCGGVVTALAGLWLACSIADPRISLDVAVVDFGLLAPNESATRTIIVRNDGFGVLRIGDVSASCGCSQIDIADRELEAGESTRLRVTITPRTAMSGGVISVVTIHSNDPRSPSATINLQCHTMAGISIKPDVVHLTREQSTAIGPPSSVSIQFPPDRWSEAMELAVTCSDPFIETSVQHLADRRTVNISVRLREGTPWGQFDSELLVALPARHVNHTVRIACKVLGEVFAQPPALVLSLPRTIPSDAKPADVLARIELRHKDAAEVGPIVAVATSPAFTDWLICESPSDADGKTVIVRSGTAVRTNAPSHYAIRGQLLIGFQQEDHIQQIAIPTILFVAR